MASSASSRGWGGWSSPSLAVPLIAGAAVVAVLAVHTSLRAAHRRKRREEESGLLPKSGLTSVDELTVDQIKTLLEVAARCKENVVMWRGGGCDGGKRGGPRRRGGRGGRGGKCALRGKVLGLLFFEASTRTRCSFEAAMKRLGGTTISVGDVATSSRSKGETMEDTVRMMSGYCDAIVIRDPSEGAAVRACKVSDVPVINGGDGAGQHPTQALLDLFTISEAFPSLLMTPPKLEGATLRIAFVGDLKYGRTVHSLAVLLSRFDTTLRFVAPEGLNLPEEYLTNIKTNFSTLRGKGEDSSRISFHTSLSHVLDKSDIIYMTRIQKERFEDQALYERCASAFVLTKKDLDALAPPHCRILHPLPRVGEIAKDVDDDPRALYFTQAENGVYMRMALLLSAMQNSKHNENTKK